MRKKGGKNKIYSSKFKIDVIMDMRENCLEYRKIVRKYWDVSYWQEQNYYKQAQRWERIYLEEGTEGLMNERRGKAYSADEIRKGRPQKLDKKVVEENLIAENQRLRI